LRHAIRGLAINLLFEAPRRVPHSQAPRGAVSEEFPKDGESVGAMLDEASHLTRPKGAAATENEESLEEAGFAGPVRAEDEIESAVELELGLPQTPQCRDPDSTQRQALFPQPGAPG
jgi:hypothetical protein